MGPTFGRCGAPQSGRSPNRGSRLEDISLISLIDGLVGRPRLAVDGDVQVAVSNGKVLDSRARSVGRRSMGCGRPRRRPLGRVRVAQSRRRSSLRWLYRPPREATRRTSRVPSKAMGMQVIADHGRIDDSVTGTAVSIGVYDGVHLGHRALLASCANTPSGRSGHRGRHLRQASCPRHPARERAQVADTLEQKLELLDEAGIDYVYLVEFDDERAQTSAADFFREVFVEGVRAKSIVVGEDFHFGETARATSSCLHTRGRGRGIDVTGLELVKVSRDAPEPVSSTAIRRKLAGGDIAAVNAMLGRRSRSAARSSRATSGAHHRVPDRQHSGAEADGVAGRRGVRRLVHPPRRHPAHGRDQHRARPDVLRTRRAVAARGPSARLRRRLYGETGPDPVRGFLRSEQRFDGIDALAAQLKQDIQRTRRSWPCRALG